LNRCFIIALLLTTWTVSGAQKQAPPAPKAAPPAAAAPQGQLDASQTLFTVLAAINAAGYDADLSLSSNSPLRQTMRNWAAAKAPATVNELRTFFREHRQADSAAELSQYVSFALCAGDPPEFRWRYRVADLPPDVQALEGLQGLLIRFYQDASIAEAWQKSQPLIEESLARYHGPVTNALMLVNAYLRTSTSGPLGARFQVFVDLLGAPNQVQTRSYHNDYFVVVTPSEELPIDSIRHAYLHFMLDPLPIRYVDELAKKRALIDYAQAAPFLEDEYKRDFLRLAGECMVKAMEARLAPASARERLVDQALRQGYILTPALSEALAVYEKQEQSMRFYYPTLVGKIDLKREEERLEKLEFATERPPQKVRMSEHPAQPVGAEKTLEEAERLYFAEPPDYAGARAGYQRALTETSNRTLQAKAYYGLARVALRQNDAGAAGKLLGQTLECEPDPQTKAWAQVYLGRLADAAGESEQAVQRYRAALGVEGASEKARQAARKGLERAGYHE
jgi:predicted negative regulator of RcsB-dependent stress response